MHQLVIKEGSVLLMHGVTMKFNFRSVLLLVTCCGFCENPPSDFFGGKGGPGLLFHEVSRSHSTTHYSR